MLPGFEAYSEIFENKIEKEISNRPNRLMFVLPISSHVTKLLPTFSITLLFALMVQLFMARNLSEKSKDILSRH